jgi:hypothetical protein
MKLSFRSFALILILFAASIASAAPPCVDAGGQISVSPPALVYGDVEVGTSKTLFFTIRNLDDFSPLNVNSMTSQNGRFQIIGAPSLPFCLSPNQSIDIRVDFVPLSATLNVSKIRITHSDPKQAAVFVGTNGNGVEGGGGGGGTNFKLTPTSLDFGEINVGRTSTESFRIRNLGSSLVTIARITSNNNAFRVVSPSFPRNLSAGGEISVNVSFAPRSAGNFNAKLSIFVGQSVESTLSISGKASAGNPEISFSAQQLDFGQVDIGTFNARSLTISNTGNADLEVSFPKDAFVKVVPAGPLRIAAGKDSRVEVRLIADKTGSINKTLTVFSSDEDEKQTRISLRANGVTGPFGFLDRSVRSNVAGNPNKTSAIQMVDFNKDGREDIYLTGNDGNIMCKNNGKAIFSNSTNASRLGNNGLDARGVTWGDIDNDGDLDAFIANFDAPSALLKNNNNVFSQQNTGLGIFAADNTPRSQGGILLDFNNDSRLDIFVVKDGAPNQLFKNIGGFQFAEIASSARVAFNGPSRSAISADFNNDGFVDLYVVNFQRPNKLYLNNRNETFRDVSASSGAAFSGASQQAAAVDFDGDQDIDIFVANNNGPSVLLRNNGSAKFQNATGAAGLAGPKKGQSASFSDFDRDGDPDLVLVQSLGDNLLFRNNGNGRFTRITNVDLSNSDNPSSVGNADTDNDGDSDIAIGDNDGGLNSGDSVYQNTGGSGNNTLTVVLVGTKNNRSAIGAKVLVRAGVLLQAQAVTAGNGRTQDSFPLEFGLATNTSATVVVFWPGGGIQTVENVSANQKITITEQ